MSTKNISEIFNQEHKKPIQRWYRDVAIRQQSHSELAEEFDSKERSLSTLAVGLNAIASSIIFTTVSTSPSSTEMSAYTSALSVFAGIIAASNTILQAILKNLQYAQSAEQHQQAFRQYTQMRFRLESIFGYEYHDDEYLDRSNLNLWIKEYRDLLETSPLIPQDVFDAKAKKEDAAYRISSSKALPIENTNPSVIIETPELDNNDNHDDNSAQASKPASYQDTVTDNSLKKNKGSDASGNIIASEKSPLLSLQI